MSKDMRIRTKDGRTMYPVCSWQENQHKLYNALDRIWNAIHDAEDSGASTDALYERMRAIQEALEAFDAGARSDGLVYAEWKQAEAIKDIIAAYDARH